MNLQDALVQFQKELDLMTHTLEKRLPEFEVQLHKLNTLLRAQPELTHMLTEESIGQLMRGVIQDSNVQFMSGVKPKAKAMQLSPDIIANMEF